MGTAQLGMRYGITNTTSLNQLEKQELLAAALAGGIETIDTARAYGDSEATIGEFLQGRRNETCRIVTKLSPLSELAPNASRDEIYQNVMASITSSRQALGCAQLDTLLLHRALHLTAWNGAIWQILCELAAQKVIGKIGVSVQSPAELLLALQYPEVAHIQLPYNILDWRWDDAPTALRRVRNRRPLAIHVRSVLLQGLLTTEERAKWAHAGMKQPDPIRTWLDTTTRAFGRKNIADLCIAYVIAQDWIDGLVIGIDNLQQLGVNLDLIAQPPLDEKQLQFLSIGRPRVPETVLDPAQWRSSK